MRSNIDGENCDDCNVNHDDNINTLVRKASNVDIDGDNCVDGDFNYGDDTKMLLKPTCI